MRSRIAMSAALLATALSAGCTKFHEVHYFQSSSRNGPTNFFRVVVEGDAQTARARYIAGFYDERAVDLYFNELKSAQGEEAQIRKLFVDNQKEPGDSSATIKPLTPDKARGTFLMIFSTNPKAVADTIGNFAESQIVADAVTNLVNSRETDAARALTATVAVSNQSATVAAGELEALIPAGPAANASPPSEAALTRTYLRALEVISRETGGPSQFKDFAEARAWFGKVK